MDSRWARVLRGTLIAGFATGSAAVSHALAGGTISLVGLALALAFATVVCVALTGKRLSGWRLAASVGLSQIAFHTLFSLLSDGATVIEHGHHSMLIADASVRAPLDGTMWFGHAVAATVTLFALHYGERAFWRLAQLLFVALRLRFALATPTTPLLADYRPVAILRAALLRSVLKYRGPPVAFH